MNHPSLIDLLRGVVAAAALGGLATSAFAASDRAQVLSVKPVTKTVSAPKEVCHDEQVVEKAPVKDENRVAGTALGAIAGGLLGHQVGGGTGRTLATVAGAAAGGYAGNQVQKKMQNSDTVTRTEKRCETVQEKQKQTFYDVRYKLDGKIATVRMKEKPTSGYLPARNGKLRLDAATPAPAPAAAPAATPAP